MPYLIFFIYNFVVVLFNFTSILNVTNQYWRETIQFANSYIFYISDKKKRYMMLLFTTYTLTYACKLTLQFTHHTVYKMRSNEYKLLNKLCPINYYIILKITRYYALSYYFITIKRLIITLIPFAVLTHYLNG